MKDRRIGRTTLAGVILFSSLSCGHLRLADRPPSRGGYFCVNAYHYCPQCGSLQGGIYGKGPFLTFPGPDKAKCRHGWQEISRAEFKQMATEKYDQDWSQEPARFWNSDNDSDARPVSHDLGE